MEMRRRARLRVAGLMLQLCVGLAAAALLAACAMPGDAAPVVKIGLIAPFEGVGRPLGYAVLPEVKAAIAEVNALGRLGRYRVALVALNDDLDPASAAAQALALAQDDALVAVIGPFGEQTGAAAAEIAAAAGIPMLVAAPLKPPSTAIFSLCPRVIEISDALSAAARTLSGSGGSGKAPPSVFFPGDALAAAEVLAGHSGGLVVGPDALRPWLIQHAGAAAEATVAAACSLAGLPAAPGGLPEASLARAATETLLRALAADIRDHGRPSRQGVMATLAQQNIRPELRWYQMRNGVWLAQDSATAPGGSPGGPAVAP